MRAEEKRKDTRFRLWEFVAFGDLDKVMPNWKSAMRDVFIAFEVYAFRHTSVKNAHRFLSNQNP